MHKSVLLADVAPIQLQVKPPIAQHKFCKGKIAIYTFSRSLPLPGLTLAAIYLRSQQEEQHIHARCWVLR